MVDSLYGEWRSVQDPWSHIILLWKFNDMEQFQITWASFSNIYWVAPLPKLCVKHCKCNYTHSKILSLSNLYMFVKSVKVIQLPQFTRLDSPHLQHALFSVGEPT